MRKTKPKIQKPPDKFFEFLSIANTLLGRFLPSYSSLMEFFELQMIENLKSESEARQLAYEGTEKAILLAIKAHPILCSYIFGKSPEDEISSAEFFERVGLYEQIRTFTITIAHAVNRTAFTNETRPNETVFLDIMPAQVLFTINPAGELTKKVIDYEIFEGVDLRRFKFCPVCGEIFWAFRSDKQACDRCSNVYRQKIFQSKNKDEINEKRRRNYAYNKAIKKEKK
jgi:ribosomal protein S27AE